MFLYKKILKTEIETGFNIVSKILLKEIINLEKNHPYLRNGSSEHQKIQIQK